VAGIELGAGIVEVGNDAFSSCDEGAEVVLLPSIKWPRFIVMPKMFSGKSLMK